MIAPDRYLDYRESRARASKPLLFSSWQGLPPRTRTLPPRIQILPRTRTLPPRTRILPTRTPPPPRIQILTKTLPLHRWTPPRCPNHRRFPEAPCRRYRGARWLPAGPSCGAQLRSPWRSKRTTPPGYAACRDREGTGPGRPRCRTVPAPDSV